MLKYWWIILTGALFALSSCQWQKTTELNKTYTIQGITAYQGQDVSSLYDMNGAPNKVQTLENGDIIWIYYTNYRPIGGGELITYDVPTNNSDETSCKVQVVLQNNQVSQVISGCN